jgi:2,3-bisphosphoglycerate-independent phosphoglycerate mutase
MGNSEVHMNLGAGRIVYQDLLKSNLAVANETPARTGAKRCFSVCKTRIKSPLPGISIRWWCSLSILRT